MKLAEELGRSRDEVTSHQKVSGPWAGVPGAAVLKSAAGSVLPGGEAAQG